MLLKRNVGYAGIFRWMDDHRGGTICLKANFGWDFDQNAHEYHPWIQGRAHGGCWCFLSFKFSAGNRY